MTLQAPDPCSLPSPQPSLRVASQLRDELITRCMSSGSTAAFAKANDLNEAHVNKVIARGKSPCAELVRALGYRPVTYYEKRKG